jgi:MFS family permease
MRSRPLILVSLLLAAFAINLDTTIVNVALPTLVRKLHASNSQLQWIVDAYNLVFAALLLASGSLSDRIGRKGMLLGGLAVFGLASAAGGLTTTPGQLIVARCVMGLGAAMIFPATLSLISNVFTERSERARAIGLWGATAGIAIALGPIVGGWLLERFSWTSIFFALTPVAALAAAFVARTVPTSRDPHAAKLDGPGFGLSTAAMALLIYTIIEAPNHGWSSARTLISFAVTISFFSLFGFIFLITQFFQFFKLYGPLSTGVHLLPVATCVGIGSVLGTKLGVRFSTKLVVAAGLVMMAAFYAWVSTGSATTRYSTIAMQMVVFGTGMGFTSAPATEAIMGVVPTHKAGVGSAVNDATRLLGGTLGVAVIGSVYASLYASRLTTLLPARLPAAIVHATHESVGAALIVAGHLGRAGQLAAGRTVHDAASNAFFHGFSAANIVLAGVAAAGALMALALLPAHPARAAADAGQGPVEAQAAAALE